MAIRDDKFVNALRIVVQEEIGIKLTQEDAVILANAQKDFSKVLLLMIHREDCPKKEELEKYIKQRWGKKRKINMTITNYDNHN